MLDTIGQFLPKWKDLDESKIKLERMAGITNEIYRVSHPDTKEILVYRKFGDAEDSIIFSWYVDLFLNRRTEEFIYKYISEKGVGPKVYGMTEDIRIEEFI